MERVEHEAEPGRNEAADQDAPGTDAGASAADGALAGSAVAGSAVAGSAVAVSAATDDPAADGPAGSAVSGRAAADRRVADAPAEQTTGEPRVDAALKLLDRLPGLPVSDHPELFEQVHARLSEVLNELESGPGAAGLAGG